MIQSFDGKSPEIAETAYVHPNASIIGDVRIKKKASVWPGAVLRGDLGPIIIEEEANVQDNAVLHSDPGTETQILNEATIGHGAVIHGAKIGRQSVIGMNCCVLDNAVVGENTIVASGSVVTENQEVSDGVMVTGSPAEVKKEIDKESPWFLSGEFYTDLAQRHKQEKLENDPEIE